MPKDRYDDEAQMAFLRELREKKRKKIEKEKRLYQNLKKRLKSFFFGTGRG